MSLAGEESFLGDASPPTNREILPDLLLKTPKDIVLVIGTGISAATLPHVPAVRSWKGLIKALIDSATKFDLLEDYEKEQLEKSLHKDINVLDIAHNLIKMLSPRTPNSKTTFLKDILFDVFHNIHLQIQEPEDQLIKCILRLMDNGARILTTNLDKIIEGYAETKGRCLDSIDLTQEDKVLEWARKETNSILHIHGIYTNPQGVVLDHEGYRSILTLKTMHEVQKLYLKKSFVFLGCGLTLEDSTFQAFTFEKAKQKSNIDHFYLLAREYVGDFAALRDRLLIKNIKVIPYGQQYSDLPIYLEKISTKICSQAGEGSPQETQQMQKRSKRPRVKRTSRSRQRGRHHKC